ncbi:MAG: zinc ribbon domain-containing protein [Halorhodospira halophila]|uniref:FmdB family zinc ribbon protein n=1 Tax=Halorhodospira TaxID=85108 RepID=UPI00191481AC|nr:MULTISPECIES: zinc ribbon domain-containing protein [Halorhodospira]MBK5935680.1 FmdB family transcriptional regulator [Halorhodospira halophila]MBK5944538.1 FmdB family transcriptional regulator [Halorhodospira halophila]MCC3751069.1 zinc ribbon domain-containing protein [Halorhodospira halophila]MCG5527316.1 zinc ribbon domain-containing protein [Halorhodospira halophila]MCG5532457.1 zinc ribbon domain-containing protein [Halorhodospira sp. 9621]
MPIYEYECCGCGHRLEAIQSVSDGPLTDCPECGQASLKRLVSAAAFRLKGGGWYETDFKSGQRKNVAEGGGNGADKGGSDKSSDKSGDKSASSAGTSAGSGGGQSGAAAAGSSGSASS